MTATLQVIKTSFPEVRPWVQFWCYGWGWNRWDGEQFRLSEVPHGNRHSNSSFPKLLSLNLRNNRLFQLDGLSDITQMVPTIRILNLSKNEVREGRIKEWLRAVGGGYESADGGQAQGPVGKGGGCGFRGLDAPLSLGLVFTFLPAILQLNCTWELGKIKGLKLEELWLEGNPLCDTFPDQSTYIRSV